MNHCDTIYVVRDSMMIHCDTIYVKLETV
jgi:hypothetical protein